MSLENIYQKSAEIVIVPPIKKAHQCSIVATVAFKTSGPLVNAPLENLKSKRWKGFDFIGPQFVFIVFVS